MLPRALPLAAIIFAGCSVFFNKSFLLRNFTYQLNLSSACTK
jgi:hypothetical protein